MKESMVFTAAKWGIFQSVYGISYNCETQAFEGVIPDHCREREKSRDRSSESCF